LGIGDDSTPQGGAQPFAYTEDDLPDTGDDESLAGMPIKDGPPNTWVENPSGSGQLRLYDANGNAVVNIDFDHDHGFGAPHSHNWNGQDRDLGKARSRVTRLHAALRLIKGKLGVTRKRHDLGELLIELFRERVTPTEWQSIVADARRRADEQKPLRDEVPHAAFEPVDRETARRQPGGIPD